MVRIPASRTAVPAPPAWFVPRHALRRHLDAARAGQLTAVVAPAGSGKTVLLADWARRASAGDGPPTAWAGLDRDDADPDRFWSVVLAAVLATGAVPAGSTLHDLTGAGDDLADDLLDGLAALSRPIRLVLDDAHVLNGRQAGVRALARLVRHRPASVHLVLAARSDPPVGLPRLRLEDALHELRADGLRFSLPDTAALAAASGVALEADDVATLHRRTEGWAAGLRLAVLALRRETEAPGRSGPPGARALLVRFTGDDRSVADYLGGELLAGLDPDDREVLDDLSVCRRLPDALAVTLTGHDDIARRLEELAQGLGMVERVDAGEHHVHALLRSHLAADLARRRPERHRRQHATAARWWAGHGETAHALHHAERAADPALTAELLGRLAVPLLLRGELAALRRALGSLGPGAVGADPALALAATLLHLEAREPTPAAAHLRLAQRAWPAAPAPDLVALRAACELLASSAGVGSPDPGSSPVEEVEEPADPGLAALLHLARGTALLAGSPRNVATARGELHRALAPARAGGLVRLESAVLAELALAALVEGDPGGVTAPGEAAPGDTTRPARTMALLAWSDLLRGDPRAAADRCAGLLGPPGPPGIGDGRDGLAPADRYALRALHGAAIGDLGRRGAGLAEARAARDELGEAALPAAVAGALALLEHRAALVLGNLRAAGDVASWLAARAGDTDEGALMHAWTAAATGRWETARSGIAALHRAGRCPGTVLIEAGLLEAEAALRADESERGRATLDAVLAAAGARDVVRPFPLAGPRVRALLLERKPVPGHGARVAAACAAVTEEPSPPLSERELVVLALLPSLLDAPTMAEELVVSVNTVKTQIRSIYAKLGVSTRRGAVTRARERGLLV